ncbi:hypothetical protein [Parendozoicomonas haliclonae]|uniref:Uncharacterized protein n=1 Tax=Parendozoicomonas haliclonae TaxID=1960125 RepID=A0A1X7AJ93_9GAMM|nr:hypothetical protein [Parendozoicomonas haliclonae]SMA45137.1 hypothetical protein EHSB41UT_01852 [Parendozoicomonas haliclonae]
MPVYKFKTEDAEEFGSADAAAIVYNLRHWLTVNKEKAQNIHDGRVWTYNSLDSFIELFPWLSRDQIKRHFLRLEQHGILLKGNYNRNSFDKTAWYSLDELKYAVSPVVVDGAKSPHREGEFATPMERNRHIEGAKSPCVTDIKPDLKQTDLKPNLKHPQHTLTRERSLDCQNWQSFQDLEEAARALGYSREASEEAVYALSAYSRLYEWATHQQWLEMGPKVNRGIIDRMIWTKQNIAICDDVAEFVVDRYEARKSRAKMMNLGYLLGDHAEDGLMDALVAVGEASPEGVERPEATRFYQENTEKLEALRRIYEQQRHSIRREIDGYSET